MSETKGLTNDLLKSKMPDAMVYRGYCRDINEAYQSGFYAVGSSTTNGKPISQCYGVLIVLNADVYKAQIIACTQGIYSRIQDGSHPWSSWLSYAKTS